ncbi:MAG TPA: HNH endonuclease, partial [Pyrinomonadaceae bacterium]|nr:HNH endonuclease [Pyrinomonadaceae bacterium]
PKNSYNLNPKEVDQPEVSFKGTLTQNGKFHKAAQDYKNGLCNAELVKVYEKIRDGIWSYNGFFELIDSWIENDGKRHVFKFKLIGIEDIDLNSETVEIHERRRIIPTEIKLEVWKRDDGKCTMCGATDELHFDHILPFSKGGTSIKVENVQLLCARHNLEKSDKII